MAGDSVVSVPHASRSGPGAGPGRRDPFFFGISIVLLLAVLVGFAPTLYLSAFRDLPPLPGHLHVHGAILTSWFVWVVLQASLIKTNRIAQHRRLGVVGAILGLAVVFAGPLALGALLLAVVLHDVIATRRVHTSTLLGTAFVALMIAAGFAIGPSSFGLAFVRGM